MELGGDGIQVTPTADGRIIAHLDLKGLAQDLAKAYPGDPAAAAQRIGLLLDEETTHAASFASLRDLWRSQGSPGNFDAFVQQHSQDVANEVIRNVESLPAAEQQAAKKAIADSMRSYYGVGPQFNDEAVWHVLSKDPGLQRIFAGEAPRQVSQLARLSTTTESARDPDPNTLAATRTLLDLIGDGKLGPKMRQEVLRTHDALGGNPPPQGQSAP